MVWRVLCLYLLDWNIMLHIQHPCLNILIIHWSKEKWWRNILAMCKSYKAKSDNECWWEVFPLSNIPEHCIESHSSPLLLGYLSWQDVVKMLLSTISFSLNNHLRIKNVLHTSWFCRLSHSCSISVYFLLSKSAWQLLSWVSQAGEVCVP